MVALTARPFPIGVLDTDAGDFPDGIQYSAHDFRSLIDAALDEGAIGEAGLVTQRAAGANASVDINGGLFVVKGDTESGQGKYVQRIDDDLNFDDIPGPPASGTRRHLLYLKTNDPQAGVGTIYQSEVLLAPDIGSGRPGTPANAAPLAEVRRVAGRTSVLDGDITDLRPRGRGTVQGFFEFYGGDNQPLPKNQVKRYAPSGVRYAYGCTIANSKDARVTGFKTGLWLFSFSARLAGAAIAAGPGTIEVVSNGPSNLRTIPCGRSQSAASVAMHSSGPLLVRSTDVVDANIWQNVYNTSNLIDDKSECRFQGVMLGSIVGFHN